MLSALDRQSVVPLYYQIRQLLLEQIQAGGLKPGEPVPSEQMISARMGVSRMTARAALKSEIEWSRIPLRLCPDLPDKFDAKNSLYQRYGIQVLVTEEVAEAALAPSGESRLLHIKQRSPVLLFSRISYGENQEPVEYVTSIYGTTATRSLID